MKKRGPITIILLMGVVFLISCSKEPTEQELYTCNDDHECIIVSTDCCPCGSTAINKEYTEYWSRQLGCQNRETIACLAIGCSETEAVCRQGKCQQVSPIIPSVKNLKPLESAVITQKIKNTNADLLRFRVSIEQVKSQGDLIFGESIADNFFYNPEIQNLQPYQSTYISINITSEATLGNGLFKFIILDFTNSSTGSVYYSKSFFVRVLS